MNLFYQIIHCIKARNSYFPPLSSHKWISSYGQLPVISIKATEHLYKMDKIWISRWRIIPADITNIYCAQWQPFLPLSPSLTTPPAFPSHTRHISRLRNWWGERFQPWSIPSFWELAQLSFWTLVVLGGGWPSVFGISKFHNQNPRVFLIQILYPILIQIHSFLLYPPFGIWFEREDWFLH